MATDYSNLQQSAIRTDEEGSSDSAQLNPAKRQAIVAACSAENLAELRSLADSTGGFLSDDLRRLAWPLLVGCNNGAAGCIDHNWRELPQHQDEEQVQKDVDRAFVYYPDQESGEDTTKRKLKLFDLIISVLRTFQMLHYFQGYHDIVQILLLVLGEAAASESVSRISLLRIRDYMLPSISPAVKQLELIPAIIRSADAELANHLSSTPPWFALSSTLTLYAHDIEQYSDIVRVFDFLLAHEPIMTLYLFASVIMSRRDLLMEISADDRDMLLFTLSKLPRPLDVDILTQGAIELYENHPPENLPGRAWASLSQYSVLKTARAENLGAGGMKKAQELFNKHASQLRRQETLAQIRSGLIRRRRPLFSITATIFVGILSYWLRKTGNDKLLLASASQLLGSLRRILFS